MKLTEESVIAVVDGNYAVSLDECVNDVVKQILENQEVVERLKEWIKIQQNLYDTEKYIEDLKYLTFNPWDNLEELRKISRGEKSEFI